ncbi:spore coat protein [Laceyella putida]|jgi:spore coat protein CotF|uniref:Spore coat protein n=1 Tax=Laceyella putida TaxID=110101 RepID=A0ABW2RK91_9BACL
MQPINPQNLMENQTVNPVPPVMNHAGHEVLDVHEILSHAVNTLDTYVMLRQHVKDPELADIMQRQYQYMVNEYNTLVECFSTGRDPSKPTSRYQMKQGNNVVYGLKPGQPKKPMTSPTEINDQRVSSQMLSCVKTGAGHRAVAATETTNPVVRRVLADSIPNCIEMAYEIFLYQNKHGYYQVPQFSPQEMQQLTTSYSPASPQLPLQ